jgi:hypothetical protein
VRISDGLREFRDVFLLNTSSVFDKAEDFIIGIFFASDWNIERINEELSENYFYCSISSLIVQGMVILYPKRSVSS